jgi:hypothetical protein
MGNTGGVLKRWTDTNRTELTRSYIISERLENITKLLTNNKNIQELFLVYILSGAWVENFVEDKGRMAWDIFVNRASPVGLSILASESEIGNRRKFSNQEASLTCESERDDSSSGLNFRTAFFKMLQIRT